MEPGRHGIHVLAASFGLRDMRPDCGLTIQQGLSKTAFAHWRDGAGIGGGGMLVRYPLMAFLFAVRGTRSGGTGLCGLPHSQPHHHELVCTKAWHGLGFGSDRRRTQFRIRLYDGVNH